MKNIFTKKFITIISIVLVAVLIITASIFLIDSAKIANPKCYDKFLLSAFNGSYNKEGFPETYCAIDRKQDEEGNEVFEYIKVKFSSSTVATSVYEIWVNVSDLKTDLQTTVLHTSSATYFENVSNMTKIASKTITKAELKKDEDGWIRIFTKADTQSTTLYSYFAFGFYGEGRVREIACVGENGKLVEYTYKASSLGKYALDSLEGEKATDEQTKTIWEQAE